MTRNEKVLYSVLLMHSHLELAQWQSNCIIYLCFGSTLSSEIDAVFD